MQGLIRHLPVVALTLSLSACGGGAEPGHDYDDPQNGATDFISADGSRGGFQEGYGDGIPAAAPSDEQEGGKRTVEEGDIFRILGGGRIANLNAYRGLQILDVSSLDTPNVLSRVPLTGVPVELYVSGSRAYVLVNDWRGYYGRRSDALPESVNGGLVLHVDLSKPEEPSILSRHLVPGRIRTSRLVRGDGEEALYVVSNEYGPATTKVRSFRFDGAAFLPADEIDLGGSAADIQATPDALLVATHGQRSIVTLIDISQPDGAMTRGGEVEVKGRVASQFNMDLRGGILRVVSGSVGGDLINHVETFDASDLRHLVPIDHQTFGSGQQLYATLFLDDRAFFVTYFRVDPFHAFSISSDGMLEEVSEFIVSGWNDFFRSVANDRRLIGIGMDDQEGRTMAVSLYDITDLSNPSPLLRRAHVEAQWSWSEASWDHRAFSVLEGAVSVFSEDGAEETGLVLLPFSGYEPGEGYRSAVQVFTFSENTLTRRGIMEHGTEVRRSFLVRASHAANLSAEELSIFSFEDPDAPSLAATLDLAPNYTGLLVLGDTGVRIRGGHDGWYRDGSALDSTPSRAELFSLSGHPDEAPTLSTLEIEGNGSFRKVGPHLAAIGRRWSSDNRLEAVVRTFDLEDPRKPKQVAELTSPDLVPSDLYHDWGWSGWWGGWAGAGIYGTDRGLAFVGLVNESEEFRTYPAYRHWRRFSIRVLDLTSSLEPRLGAELRLPREEEAVGIVQDGNVLYLSTKMPHPRAGDPRRYARYFVRRIDLSNPAAPVIGRAISVPGSLLAVEGSTLFTRDRVWAGAYIDTAVNRLHLGREVATLEARRRFAGQVVDQILLDEKGHLLVTHYQDLRGGMDWDAWEFEMKTSVLEGRGAGIPILSTVEMESWASLRGTALGRALFHVPGGLLVVSLENPKRPEAQAYFPSLGWPNEMVVDGDRLLVPSGRFGIHAFDLETRNLLSK